MDITQGLVAREAIRDLMMQYFLNVDAARSQELGALCTEDATLTIKNVFAGPDSRSINFTDRAGIIEHVSSFGSALGFMRHHCTTCLIEVDGDQATGHLYYEVFNKDGMDHIGEMENRFVKVGESWLIKSVDVKTTKTIPLLSNV